MDDLLPDAACADCGKNIQVLWCQLWDAFLCVFCRANRTERDMRESKRKWHAATAKQ